jgi:hypothetical protein
LCDRRSCLPSKLRHVRLRAPGSRNAVEASATLFIATITATTTTTTSATTFTALITWPTFRPTQTRPSLVYARILVNIPWTVSVMTAGRGPHTLIVHTATTAMTAAFVLTTRYHLPLHPSHLFLLSHRRTHLLPRPSSPVSAKTLASIPWMASVTMASQDPHTLTVRMATTVTTAVCVPIIHAQEVAHVVRRVLFMIEGLDEGLWDFYSCKGQDNPANVFTKPVGLTPFTAARAIYLGHLNGPLLDT